MEMDGGVMRMRAVDGGVVIAAGDSVTLAPGGFAYHVDGFEHRFARRQSAHEITLVFEKAGQVTLTVTAKLPAEIKMTMPVTRPRTIILCQKHLNKCRYLRQWQRRGRGRSPDRKTHLASCHGRSAAPQQAPFQTAAYSG